jgi:hypothetical protein
VTFTAGQSGLLHHDDLGIDDLLSLETIIGPASGNLANVHDGSDVPERLLAMRSRRRCRATLRGCSRSTASTR